MKSEKKIKSIFLALVLAELVFAYAAPAYAQQQTTVPDYTKSGVQATIEKFLCSPTKDSGGTWFKPGGVSGNEGATNVAQNDLYLCINKLYRFAIAIGSVAGILMIVIAGYLYMSSDGNQESVDKAKSIVLSTITAMVILFAGYVLLRTINPDLIAFKSIQPPSIKLPPAPAPGAGVTPTGGLTEDQARQTLASNGITVNAQPPQTILAGMKQNTINEIVNVKKACNCDVVVTGGTEQGHNEGTCSHANGYKFDLRTNTQLDNFLKTYRASSGAKYVLESSPAHWDVAVCQ